MKLKRFEHPGFTSNTYVLFSEQTDAAYVVDIGEYKQSKAFLATFSSVPILLITHAHYDHIYCINEFLEDYPACKVYASSYAIECLASPKLNLSFYHNDPVAYTGDALREANNDRTITLSQSYDAKVIATPGHTPGCLSFLVDNYLFTGDALIPGHEVVTKLRGGDKSLSRKSVSLIKDMLKPNMVLCPGHYNTILGKEIA